MLGWGMTMQKAMQTPHFSAASDASDISNRISRAVQRELERMGYRVRRSPLSYPFVASHGMMMFNGVFEGAAYPQHENYVAGIT